MRQHIIIAAFIALLLHIPTSCEASAEGTLGKQDVQQAETYVRQQLVSFLQSGSDICSIPPSHMLFPLRRIPCLATVSYMVMSHDPAMLERFYPDITRLASEIFSTDRMSRNGFIFGSGCGLVDGDTAILPSVNAMACVELYSLAAIAARTGHYEDAMEYRKWAEDYSEFVSSSLYDPARDSFFPLSDSGYYIIRYSPAFLIPMLTADGTGKKSVARIADRTIHNMMSRSNITDPEHDLWTDPLIRPMILSLLSNIDGFPLQRLKARIDIPGTSLNAMQGDMARQSWISIWDPAFSNVTEIFSTTSIIFSLKIFSRIMERESLLDSKEAEQFFNDVESLERSLHSSRSDISDHIADIELANRLLVKMGKMSSYFDSGEKLWKIIDDVRWQRLSPRLRKQIRLSCTSSISALMKAKTAMSSSFMESSGIVAEIRLPDSGVPLGKSVEVEIFIRSRTIPFELERLYLQIAGSRWKLIEDGEKITLEPGGVPEKWQRQLSLSPTSDPGIMKLPVFFDFLHEGKRVELHIAESVTIKKGFDVSLDFPAGRRLEKGGELPLNINIRYNNSSTLQGEVTGVFLPDLSCTPELPARFAIREGAEITSLPLTLGYGRDLSPGDYPVSITVDLGGKTIAVFDEILTRPVEWIHMGPIKNRRWALEEAVQLQDDLYSTYLSPEGKQLRWIEVPPGARDHAGGVLPERLYGSGSDRCMLLFTVVSMKQAGNVKWHLESPNIISLWINSTQILTASGENTDYSGTTMLRAGRNAILIAAYWSGPSGPVLLNLGDKAGLPVPGLENDMQRIMSSLPALAEGAAGEENMVHSGDQPREVSLQLDYPEAGEVSVIGEFNNWAPESAVMKKRADGRWYATLILPRGNYQYKFLVDRKTKITDPLSASSVPDGFGGMNSILVVK